ncbi:hotdog fold thioesterase [Hymenobacter cavernae]|uniref:Thioesterase n=1 Tax=Hymenobacter cavernae TaxID=2044852 RepID=A0ABQ1USY5_9BACT|nr:hotdog fold thioesterase [Hymenobacter cavernae]GGF24227.1 thioesterase [Hymenobacter cavernae]
MNFPTHDLAQLNEWSRNTLSEHLGIELTEVGDKYLVGRMPVDRRTHQPMGLLHGGASVALAETLGSIGAALQVDLTKKACVGLEINANHIKGVHSGYVVGRATAVHIGRSTQIWEIRITHEETGALVCLSRITMAVIDLPAKPSSAA